uniref:Uncharacterized protein n=1 Tax=Solanum tuberosum TaxID=4113 RepID=M1ADF6_SOLTU
MANLNIKVFSIATLSSSSYSSCDQLLCETYRIGFIEKERGQGPKKSTIFTSQGMQTIIRTLWLRNAPKKLKQLF